MCVCVCVCVRERERERERERGAHGQQAPGADFGRRRCGTASWLEAARRAAPAPSASARRAARTGRTRRRPCCRRRRRGPSRAACGVTVELTQRTKAVNYLLEGLIPQRPTYFNDYNILHRRPPTRPSLPAPGGSFWSSHGNSPGWKRSRRHRSLRKRPRVRVTPPHAAQQREPLAFATRAARRNSSALQQES